MIYTVQYRYSYNIFSSYCLTLPEMCFNKLIRSEFVRDVQVRVFLVFPKDSKSNLDPFDRFTDS